MERKVKLSLCKGDTILYIKSINNPPKPTKLVNKYKVEGHKDVQKYAAFLFISNELREKLRIQSHSWSQQKRISSNKLNKSDERPVH